MRIAVFYLFYYLWTLLFVGTGFIASFLPGKKILQGMVSGWAKGNLWLLRVLCSIRIKIVGTENLPKSGSFILASKHQSEADAFVFLAMFPNLAPVVMAQIATWPFFGHMAKAFGAVFVDNERGGTDSRERLNHGAAIAVAQQRPILIFPEGHLCPIGEKKRYRKGAVKMATRHNLPIIPVATNLGVFWPQRQWAKKPGVAEIHILPAINASFDNESILKMLEYTIEDTSDALLKKLDIYTESGLENEQLI